MALASYSGPDRNAIAIFEAVIGETFKAAFVDANGRVWLVVASGHALTFNGLDRGPMIPAWSIEPPHIVQNAIETRRAELRKEIDNIRRLAPGVEV